MGEFVDGWSFVQLLGEGAFAKVKLLINLSTGEACAVKEAHLPTKGGAGDEVRSVQKSASDDIEESLRKEVHIHKLLKHDNIVQCYGSRMDDVQDKRKLYIFLEYCNGGELFDRIEPDVGMRENVCQNYFLQLLDAVEYLHSRGIAHRDIKPENILFNETHQLKLTDFGMATLFRYNGRERLLERRCGTMPYIAPEVLLKPRYRATPADVWSCGIVLLAMLTGELPWDQPLPGDANFDAWRQREYSRRPIWRRLDTLTLSTLAKVLSASPTRRPSIEQIKSFLWCKKSFHDSDCSMLDSQMGQLPNLLPDNQTGGINDCASAAAFSATQPALLVGQQQVNQSGPPLTPTQRRPLLSANFGDDSARFVSSIDFPAYSQPAASTEIYNSNTQEAGPCENVSSQGATTFYRLVRRMTRFWIDSSIEPAKADVKIRSILRQLGYSVTSSTKGIYTATVRDCQRGTELTMKVTFIKVDNRLLVDFRLGHGCGLEFKKRFKHILANCDDLVDKSAVMWWSTALPIASTTLGASDEERPVKKRPVDKENAEPNTDVSGVEKRQKISPV